MNKGLVSLGTIIMDMFPGSDTTEFREGCAFKAEPGGSAANVAVCAAKLGLRSAFIGKVGDDDFGHLLASVLKKNNADVTGLRFDPVRRTTLNFHIRLPNGEYKYLFYRNPGADTNLRADEVDPAVVAQAGALHIDSLCLTDSPAKETALCLASLARKNNVPVSFDFNYRPPVWPDPSIAVEAAWEILPFVDILKVNKNEFNLLLPEKNITGGEELLFGSGIKILLLTLGAAGCHAACPGFHVDIPAMKVETVDTVGCGDAFIASFLTFLIKRGLTNVTMEQLKESVLYADAAASLTSARYGAMNALPDLSEVDKYWKERRRDFI